MSLLIAGKRLKASQVFFSSTAEGMIQAGVSESWHTLLTQLLLTPLLPHLIIVGDNRLESGDWDERQLPLWSRIINECVINRMIRKVADKRLHQSLWGKGFCHSVSLWVLANGRWITSDRLLQHYVIIFALLFKFLSWVSDDKLSFICLN